MYDESDEVKCGVCGFATIVKTRVEVGGSNSYRLACGHKNAECSKCHCLVMDASDTHKEVQPMCSICIQTAGI